MPPRPPKWRHHASNARVFGSDPDTSGTARAVDMALLVNVSLTGKWMLA